MTKKKKAYILTKLMDLSELLCTNNEYKFYWYVDPLQIKIKSTSDSTIDITHHIEFINEIMILIHNNTSLSSSMITRLQNLHEEVI